MLKVLTRLALCFLTSFGLPTASFAALNLAIEVDANPAEPGESLRVAITVANPDGISTGAITLELPYPTNLAFVSEAFISDGGGCAGTTCDPNETVVWNLPALGPGEGTTVTMAPTVLGSAPDGATVVFEVDALNGGSPAASALHQVEILTNRVFDLVIDEDRDPVLAAEALVYEITFGNRSAETTAETALTFSLPSGTTFVSASDNGTLIGGTVEWDLGALSGHEGGRRSVEVVVNGALSDGTILRGETMIEGQGDFLTHESRTASRTRVEGGSRLNVHMAINPDPARPNEALGATITVSNPTSGFINNVNLRLRYPTGIFFISESLISDGGDCAGTTCDDREELFWNLGNMPPGRGITVTLTPSIASPAGGSLITFPIALDANGLSRTLARQTLIVRSSRALDLAVDFERSPVASGNREIYTLAYGNRGSETLTGTVLRFPIPQNTAFVSASDGGIFQNGLVSWSLGNVVGHEGGQRQVEVQVGGSVEEGVLLAVDPAIIAGQGMFVSHETRARSVARVEDATRLDVATMVDRDPIEPSEVLSLRAAVMNRSNVDFANDVVLRLRYPTGFSSVSNSLIIDGACAGTTCDPLEIVTFNLGNLPPGGGAVVELPPSVAAGASGGSVITVPVEVNATDRSRSRASHSVLVHESRVLDLAIDVDSDPLSGTAFYDLTFGNRSNEATIGTTLRFPVPAGTTVEGVSNGGVVQSGGDLLGDTVVWDIGTLAARQTARRRLELALAPGVSSGTLARIFDAEISGEAAFLDHESRARDVRRIEEIDTTLVVAGTPEPAFPNNTLDTSLEVANAAPSFLFDVTLQLRYPVSLFSISNSAVSDGGFCPGTTCDGAELVTWQLGDLAPGAMMEVSLQPVVSSSVPEGSLVRYWAHVFGSNFGKAVNTKAIPVGNNFVDAGPIQRLSIFSDGFENGDTSAWSSDVP